MDQMPPLSESSTHFFHFFEMCAAVFNSFPLSSRTGRNGRCGWLNPLKIQSGPVQTSTVFFDDFSRDPEFFIGFPFEIQTQRVYTRFQLWKITRDLSCQNRFPFRILYGKVFPVGALQSIARFYG